MNASMGKVYLVGAGPGDPGLVTLRGAECLRMADIVLYDYLANRLLLAHCRPAAEAVCLGQHGRGRLMTQAEVNAAMIAAARRGGVVVRLKGGDPTTFARAAEELTALEAAGVPYEIVPGVSAAQAASSHAGIPLTDRDQASCIALVTGQESTAKRPEEQLDYAALAQFPGTLVFYMGLTTAPQWSRALVEEGKPADTRVAIVRRCSLPDQETIFTTLGEVERALGSGPGKLRPPAVVIVGEVAAARNTVNWFTSRPLFGTTVLVTRPAGQEEELALSLRELGAAVLTQPAITIGEPREWAPVDAAIRRLAEFDWLVFSSTMASITSWIVWRHSGSTRGIWAACDWRQLGRPRRQRSPTRACWRTCSPSRIGLKRWPRRSFRLRGKRFLLARASRGREVLAEMLTAAGGYVEQIVVYESADVAAADADIAAAMAGGGIQWTTVTSSAIGRSLVHLFGDSLRRTQLAVISPVTAETLRELGYEPAAVAAEYTSTGLVDAILARSKAD